MIPFDHVRLAQIIHQERTQAARARRPEWAYSAAPSARRKRSLGFTGNLRDVAARALYRLAARIEPSSRAEVGGISLT